MDEKSKEILAKLIDVLPVMPNNKKDYILGFAEGVAAGKKQEALEMVGREGKSA